MYCAWTIIVTGEEELIPTSGELKGFALIGIPFMLVTFIAEGGVEGTETESGADVVKAPSFTKPAGG
jgi:hypothetical protein